MKRFFKKLKAERTLLNVLMFIAFLFGTLLLLSNMMATAPSP